MINRETKNMDEAFVRSIMKQYGSPVYIFDEAAFVDNFKNLENAFKKVYPKYQIAYSYKTNYTPYVCKKVKELGGYAEVVSDFEYYLAKKIGYDNSKIVYNGPYKQGLLEEHLQNGGLNNIDNEQEALRIVTYAQKYPSKMFRVGIRVNLDIGQSFISRFGMDPYREEFVKVLELINGCPNIEIIGIHCHVGQSRSLQSWINRTESIIKVIDLHFRDKRLEYIDLGSGMFGDLESEFAVQFENVPTYSEYAEVVGSRLNEYYKNISAEARPLLITEPGATIVSRYFFLATTAKSHKVVRNREVVGLDSSFFNAGETVRYKKLPINVYGNGADEVTTDLVGYTCLEEDMLYSQYKGKLTVGDVVLFGNVGGYSTVFKPPFILPDCASVVWKVDGSVELIKHAQSYEDMLCNYII